MENEDFIYNQFGAKVLLKYTFSFSTYIDENSNLELFLLYIMHAQHPNKNEIKEHLLNLYQEIDNPIKYKFLDLFENELFDKIFDIKSYEVYFSQMAYNRLADNSLCYFKDILSEVVKKRPEILKSGDKESHEFILSFSSMEDLLKELTERKIKQLFYGSITDIKKFFQDRLGVQLFENPIIESNFSRFIKQRNLIVHNRGIITQEFLDEFEITDLKIGNSLYFKYEALSTISLEINRIIADIDLKIRKKFELEFKSL